MDVGHRAQSAGQACNDRRPSTVKRTTARPWREGANQTLENASGNCKPRFIAEKQPFSHHSSAYRQSSFQRTCFCKSSDRLTSFLSANCKPKNGNCRSRVVNPQVWGFEVKPIPDTFKSSCVRGKITHKERSSTSASLKLQHPQGNRRKGPSIPAATNRGSHPVGRPRHRLPAGS